MKILMPIAIIVVAYDVAKCFVESKVELNDVD